MWRNPLTAAPAPAEWRGTHGAFIAAGRLSALRLPPVLRVLHQTCSVQLPRRRAPPRARARARSRGRARCFHLNLKSRLQHRQFYCKYRSGATKHKDSEPVFILRSLSVRNVPQASDLGSVRREGADGGRLAVQVEDKLVKVRNMKVRPSLQLPALSRSHFS